MNAIIIAKYCKVFSSCVSTPRIFGDKMDTALNELDHDANGRDSDESPSSSAGRNRSMRRSLDRSIVAEEPVELNVYANKQDLSIFSALKQLKKPRGPRTAYALFMSDFRKVTLPDLALFKAIFD